jgi:hypothetical protein
MTSSRACLLLVSLAVGCTDFSYDQGTRVSDQNVLAGRTFAQGGKVETGDSLTSTDALLKPLETSINNHISFC